MMIRHNKHHGCYPSTKYLIILLCCLIIVSMAFYSICMNTSYYYSNSNNNNYVTSSSSSHNNIKFSIRSNSYNNKVRKWREEKLYETQVMQLKRMEERRKRIRPVVNNNVSEEEEDRSSSTMSDAQQHPHALMLKLGGTVDPMQWLADDDDSGNNTHTGTRSMSATKNDADEKDNDYISMEDVNDLCGKFAKGTLGMYI